MSNTAVINKNFYRGRKQDEEIEEFDREMESASKDTTDNDEKVEAKKTTTETNNNDDDNKHDWKKRHSDLRSWSQKEINRLQREVEEYKKALKDSVGGESKYPKSEEEVRAWVETYPEVAAIIETISGQKASEQTSEIEKKLLELEEQKRRMDWEVAMKKLLNLHPDFEEIRDSSDFSEFDDENRLVGGWLSEQSPRIQRLILDPELDDGGVRDAASVIKMYKVDRGLNVDTPKKSGTSKPGDAALKVTNSGSKSPKTDDGIPSFSESQIQRMSEREFEENYDLIQEAQKKGRIIKDMSGPR